MRIIIKQIDGISTPVCEETGEVVEGVTGWKMDIFPFYSEGGPLHAHLNIDLETSLPVVEEPEPIGPCPFCGATRWDTSSAGKRTWNCGTGRWGNPFKPESIMFSQSARCQRWQKEEGHAKE